MIGLSISYFIRMNFVLSAMINLFLGLVFLFYDPSFFFESQARQVCVIRNGADFHYRLASSWSQKEIRNFIFSSLIRVVF